MSIGNVFNALRLRATLDEYRRDGETYLTRAVKMGLVSTAEEFIEIGADPNRANEKGELPLFIALAQRDKLMMISLMLAGADTFEKKDGLTFREAAVKNGMRDIAAVAADIEGKRLSSLSAMIVRPGM